MKKLIFMALLLPLAFKASAQKFYNGDGPMHPQSVSITTGSQGVGAEYRYGLSERLNLRGGMNLLPVSANNIFTVSDFHSTSSGKAQFTNFHFLADFTPFQSLSFLRVVGGAAYFMQANGHITVNPTDTYKYGDIVLNKDQVGNLNMDMNWKGVAPYLGLGLIHAFPQRRFNINLDLGTYYLSQPTAQIAGTGILAGNSTQSAQLQKNIQNYRWYPQVQLNFNFKL